MRPSLFVDSVMSRLKSSGKLAGLTDDQISEVVSAALSSIDKAIDDVAKDAPFIKRNTSLEPNKLDFLHVQISSGYIFTREVRIVRVDRPYCDIKGDTKSGGVWGSFISIFDMETGAYIAGIGIDSPRHLGGAVPTEEFHKNIVESPFWGDTDLLDDIDRLSEAMVLDLLGTEVSDVRSLTFPLSIMCSQDPKDAFKMLRGDTEKFFNGLERDYADLFDVLALRSNNILYCHLATAEKYIGGFSARYEAVVAEALVGAEKVIDDIQVKAEVGESWGSW